MICDLRWLLIIRYLIPIGRGESVIETPIVAPQQSSDLSNVDSEIFSSIY